MGGHYDFTFAVDYKLDRGALRRSLRDQLDRLGLDLVAANMPIQMLVAEKAK